MDDRQIEGLMRSTLQTAPPIEMRSRTLRLARQELRKRHTGSQILGMGRWKAALAVCCVLVIALTHVSNSARQERIGDMVCRPSVSGQQIRIAQTTSLQEWENWQSEIIIRLHEIEGTDAL